MLRRLPMILVVLVFSTVSIASDRSKIDEINAALAAKLADAVIETQVVSNRDFRVQLLEFSAEADAHRTAASLGLAGGSVVHVYRNNEIFISVLPQGEDGSYLVVLTDPHDGTLTTKYIEFSDSPQSDD